MIRRNLYAIVSKQKGKDWFMVERTQRLTSIKYKLVEKMNELCTFFPSKADANEYLRHCGLKANPDIRVKKITKVPNYGAMLKASYRHFALFLITKYDDEKYFVHYDKKDKKYKLSKEKEGAKVFTLVSAKEVKDRLTFKIKGKDYALMLERVNPIRIVKGKKDKEKIEKATEKAKKKITEKS